jgi:hypothetical protein
MSDTLVQDMIRLAHEHPKARPVLVPLIRKFSTWMPGLNDMDGKEEVDLSWFEPGMVSQRPLDDIGEGSQTPPAHDHKGVPVKEEGDFNEKLLERLTKSTLHRACYRAEVLAEKELVGIKDHLERHYSDSTGKPVVLSSMELELNADKGTFEAAGRMVVAGREEPFHHSDVYYGGLSFHTSWERPPMKRTKTAGEVRFIKDRSGDKTEWGWGAPGPSEREMDKEFKFRVSKLKPLSRSLRASLLALGHAMSAYNTFAKIKSATVSPDGSLGGRGYICKIADMRRQYMNVIEALSSLTDTLFDEVNAPHWKAKQAVSDPRERKQVKEIMSDVNRIREDPEGFALGEEAEMDIERGQG